MILKSNINTNDALKKLSTFYLLLVFSLSALAAEGISLNSFILTAPAKYIADIPKTQRKKLLSLLSSPVDSQMLDYSRGWLWFASDNPDASVGTSMFWVKLLPRNADDPLVFVYMAKPIAGYGETPSNNQTYILSYTNYDWHDVTKNYMPNGIDLTMAFIPRRKSNDIQVAKYQKVPNANSSKGDTCYELEASRLILHWNGTSFKKRTVKPRRVTFDN